MKKEKFSVSQAKFEFRERYYAEAAARGCRTGLMLAGDWAKQEVEAAARAAPGLDLLAIDKDFSCVESAIRAGIVRARVWDLADSRGLRLKHGLAETYDSVNADFCGPVTANVPAIQEAARTANKLMNVTVSISHEINYTSFVSKWSPQPFALSPKWDLVSEKVKKRLFLVDAVVRDANPQAKLLNPSYYRSTGQVGMLSAVYEILPPPPPPLPPADPWVIDLSGDEVERVADIPATLPRWNHFKDGESCCAAGHPRVDPKTSENNVGYNDQCRPCYSAARAARKHVAPKRDYAKEKERKLELARLRGKAAR